MDFSVSVNPYGPPPSVIDAARKSLDRIRAYPDPEKRRLKTCVANRYWVTKSSIILGNGSAELLDLYLRAVAPKRAAILAPSFYEYERAILASGSELCHVALARDKEFLPTMETVESLTGIPGIGAILIASPQNPSGNRVPDEVLMALAARCEEKGIHLLVDESFLELTRDYEKHTLLPLLPEHPSLFVLNSFTKQYAMPGLRIGCGFCADEKLLKHMERCVQPWNLSGPALAAGEAALQEEEFLRKSRTNILEETEALFQKLKQLGLAVIHSDANFLLFQGPDGLKDAMLERGILIRDCSNFRGLTKGYYRICTRIPEENKVLVDALLGCLKDIGGGAKSDC